MASSGSCHRRAQPAGGTTVINIPRVSNPIKQTQDHEPHGVFVRRWLLALRRVPDSWLFEPWRMLADLQARCGLRVGVEIAEPLVDIEAATRAAKKRLFELRAQPEVRGASTNRRRARLTKTYSDGQQVVRQKANGPNDSGFLMGALKKSELPSKLCLCCGRPYFWRKKWAKVWDEVKYCSERCRRTRKDKP
jgi:hypothetical protein